MDAIRWDFTPHELFVVGALAGAYAIGVRGEVVPRWRLACFGGGLLLVLAAAATPLDSLATTSLLSAHLLQNVVFAEWAPALIVLGVPAGLAARLGRRRISPRAHASGRGASRCGSRRMPPGTSRPPTTRRFAISRACSTSSTRATSRPVCSSGGRCSRTRRIGSRPPRGPPTSSPRSSSPRPIGIVLSLVSSPAYDFYVAAPDMWGLSDLADQQIAGVTMSVEQAVVFFCVAAYFVLRQLRAEEARETRLEESSQIA